MRAIAVEDHLESGGLLSFKKGDIIHVLDCGQAAEALVPKFGGGGGVYTGFFQGSLGFVASHCIEFIFEADEDPTPHYIQMLEVLILFVVLLINHSQLITKPDLQVVSALCEHTDRSQMEYLAKAIVDAFSVKGDIVELIKNCIQKEVKDTGKRE